MAKYLDDTGLATLWDKIKTRDTNVQTASKNYTDTEITTLNGTLTSSINGVSGRVTSLEGYFTSGKANESIKATQDGDGAIISTTYIKVAQKGVANGVATLDSNGTIPSSQLPSFVDDVIEGYYHNGKFYKESAHTTEITAESGKIYVDLASLKTYRWSGSAFVVISETIVIGTTTGTAYDGGLGAEIRSDLDSHIGNTSNPHSVTKSQVGLGNVVNTGDSATPVQNGTTKFTTGGAYTLQQSIPTTYLKVGSVSGNTLTLTKQDNTTITFTPSFTNYYRPIKVNGTQKLANTSSTALDLVAGTNVTLTESNGAVTIDASDTDTGATSVEVTGSGNAVTTASYDDSTRKITLTKGSTFLTSHLYRPISVAGTQKLANSSGTALNFLNTGNVQFTYASGLKASVDLSNYLTSSDVQAISSDELDEILV